MDILIRKHTFNEKYNAKFFGEFTELLALELTEELLCCVFEFLEDSQTLKNAVRPLITNEEGYPPLFFKKDNAALYGYTTLGFKDISIFEQKMKPLIEYKTSLETIDKLWNYLGWTMSEIKIVRVTVGEFNNTTAMYDGYPNDFDTVEHLWNQ